MLTPTDDLQVTATAVVETRVVEADLGRRYATGHDLTATSPGTGLYPVYLRPHRVRVLYRRPRADVNQLASAPWVVTQVIVIGRAVLAMIRHERDSGSLPSERQRTFTDLDVAPAWVGDVARALATADPPTGERP